MDRVEPNLQLPRRKLYSPNRPQLATALWVACFLASCAAFATDPPTARETNLPPLTIGGVAARAHTQGIEWVGPVLYVTARREDTFPKQPLLLRTTPGSNQWEVWNLTLSNSPSTTQMLDHPGGIQSDGQSLWIPQSESRRHGHTRIRVVTLASLSPHRPIRSQQEISVADHIGALAVAPERNRVFGASWDTETVWTWDLNGKFIERLQAPQLATWQLGIEHPPKPRPGLTVQDWKWHNGHLVASGLWKDPTPGPATAPTGSSQRSRIAIFSRFLEPNANAAVYWVRLPTLPTSPANLEIAHEGMAIAQGRLWFLPEDLGPTNRLFSIEQPTSLGTAPPQ